MLQKSCNPLFKFNIYICLYMYINKNIKFHILISKWKNEKMKEDLLQRDFTDIEIQFEETFDI